jgi:RND family efflux transporter MFP subunit
VGSRNAVDVLPLVSGRVKAVHVRAGQRITRGDVLLELESDEVEAKLQAARSRLITANANFVEAQGNYDRVIKLAALKIVSTQATDEATASWKSAKAAVVGAQADLKDAQTWLGYTVLKSPIDGLVADKTVNPGDFASPTSGRPLITIFDPDALWIETHIPERYSPYIAVGTTAQVMINAVNVALQGRFDEVVPDIDQSSRAFVARVNLPPLPTLKTGMFGRVRFVTSQREVVTVPESVVVERGELDTLFVVVDGRARLRLVRCGVRSGGEVEILSGLAPGEQVIAHPAESMRDGDSL